MLFQPASSGLVPLMQPQFRRGRFAGGGPFNPSDYGTVTQWLVADDITGADGDPVTTWTARIGNDAVVSVDSPTLRTGSSGISGKKAVEFAGPGFYEFLVFENPGVRTFFAVIKGGTGSLQGIGSLGGSTTARMGLLFPDSATWYSGDANDIVITQMVNGVTTQAHSPSSKEVISGARADNYALPDDWLLSFAGFGDLFFQGLISTLLFYSDAPDMAAVQSALLSEYP